MGMFLEFRVGDCLWNRYGMVCCLFLDFLLGVFRMWGRRFGESLIFWVGILL